MGHVVDIAAGVGMDRALLGNKGAGLVRMRGLGLRVPPAFVITTQACRSYLDDGAQPPGLLDEIDAALVELERQRGLRLGDPECPLLLSVRSGAAVSMPGMMDTVLDLGVTEATRAGLVRRGGPGFALDSHRRFLESFGTVVLGIEQGAFDRVSAALEVPGAGDEERLAAEVAAFTQVIGAHADEGLLDDPRAQLRLAVEAVFRSWHSPRAAVYRRLHGIPDDLGTAVAVQAMVFGNLNARSGTGVVFTRDPNTGEALPYGDFLFTAQGEDVVSGEHDTDPLPVIADRLPEVYRQLTDVFDTLERHTRDLCDVEFTIESGRLYVLQTRVGQRSGRAAVALAVDLVDEGVITEAEALDRVTDEQLAAASAPRFTGEPPADALLARGLAASPGAVTGRAAFDAERAQRLRADGVDVVLLRPTTSPADLPGVIASVGVVTGRGGRTSHAAVVARGMGRAAVCGVGELVVARDRRSATLAGRPLVEGDEISVDGDRGVVSLGHRDVSTATTTDPALARFLGWQRTHRPAATPTPMTTPTARGSA